MPIRDEFRRAVPKQCKERLTSATSLDSAEDAKQAEQAKEAAADQEQREITTQTLKPDKKRREEGACDCTLQGAPCS